MSHLQVPNELDCVTKATGNPTVFASQNNGCPKQQMRGSKFGRWKQSLKFLRGLQYMAMGHKPSRSSEYPNPTT